MGSSHPTREVHNDALTAKLLGQSGRALLRHYGMEFRATSSVHLMHLIDANAVFMLYLGGKDEFHSIYSCHSYPVKHLDNTFLGQIPQWLIGHLSEGSAKCGNSQS
jgi:hypothetical protein